MAINTFSIRFSQLTVSPTSSLQTTVLFSTIKIKRLLYLQLFLVAFSFIIVYTISNRGIFQGFHLWWRWNITQILGLHSLEQGKNLIEILLKISDNSTFVIDEIDRCLHPAMTTKIIELFLQMAEKRDLENAFSCETILNKLRAMNFADIQEQGFIPLYTRDKLTDALNMPES